jgi:hypothetical protein
MKKLIKRSRNDKGMQLKWLEFYGEAEGRLCGMSFGLDW